MAIVDDARLFDTFRAIAAADRMVIVHPHNQSLWTSEAAKATREGRTTVRDWNRVTYGFNDVLETTPIAKVILLADAAAVRLRIAHVQGRPQLRLVRMFKEAGFRFVVETNPWSVAKVDPIGIRSPKDFNVLSPEDVEANLAAIRDGTIDVIASDHAPHTKEESERVPADVFDSLTIGMPICEHYLSIFLTEVSKGRLTLAQLVRATCEMPAKTVGLFPRKGHLGVGADADLAVLDLNKEAVLGESYPVYSKAGFTPLAGYRVKGVPVYTIAGGRVVMDHGEIPADPGFGRFIPAGSVLS
jgi:dihydroorotase-like cyclic amidohydrolase